MALTDSGTVFGWGSNTSGQLGKPPVDVEGKGENNKVLVMKTTKRVIRLQHGLQNSCDVPKPVQGLTKTGVYSEEVPDSASPAFANFYSRLQRGNAFPPVEPFFHSQQLQTFLHTTIEIFSDVLDTGKLLRKCLMLENPLAAAKISLGNKKVLQAFDLSLQAVLKTEPSTSDGESTCDKIFHCFLFYCSQPSASAQERADLFERLVACWQDRGSSLHRLEKMLLDAADQDLLHTIIYSLFCPTTTTEGETDLSQGPGKRSGGQDPRLVELFSPEFCLKIGDTFVQAMRKPTENGNGEESVLAGVDPGTSYEEQLRSLVTELMGTSESHAPST